MQKSRALKLALLAVAVSLVGPQVAAVMAQVQPAGLLQAGTSTLPPGQYMMSNISTGQSYYVFINPQGQMLAQDPRALQVSVMPLAAGQAALTTPTTTTPQKGFSGMLRQGLDSYLQNRNQAVPQQ